MITNHKQFEVTQTQLQRLELTLEELRRSVDEVEFRNQAPTVIEHIRRLRAEIDVYLGIEELKTAS